MKGNEELIEALNGLLADELTAIHQYIVHMGMASNWGYNDLAKYIFKRAKGEMKHADILIDRILFLEGTPLLQSINKLHIGKDVPDALENDHKAEEGAIAGYNAAIRLAVEVGDNATRDILEGNLEDEDDHINAIEERLDQIKQMGIANYLAVQI